MLRTILLQFTNTFKRRTGASILTVVSIAFSLILVCFISVLYNSITYPFAPEVAKDRMYYLSLSAKNKKTGEELPYYRVAAKLPQDFFFDMKDRLDCAENSMAYYVQSVNSSFSNGHEIEFEYLVVDLQFFSVLDFTFLRGNAFHPSQVSIEKTKNRSSLTYVIITESFAREIFGSIHCVGQSFRNRSEEFRVCGVVREFASSTHFQSDVYCLISEQSKLYGSYNAHHCILLKEGIPSSVLESELKHWAQRTSANHETHVFEFNSQNSFTNYISQFIRISDRITGLFFVILCVFVVLPCLCLYNILKNNLDFRLSELGVRRAFGGQRSQIICLLLFDNLLFIFVGGFLGLLFGFVGAFLFLDYPISSLFPLFFQRNQILLFFAVLCVIGCFACLFPAIRLSKHTIVHSLNHCKL